MTKWGLDASRARPPVRDSLEPIIRFFSYHDAHPVALMMVLLEKFGSDWLLWERATLSSEILDTFKATSVSEHNWEKIEAIRTLTRTVGFWSEWHIFEKVIQALNNNVPRFDIVQKCSMAQLMAGVDIANTIRSEQYGEEIQSYIAACSISSGVTYLPPPLDFAQVVLSEPKYHCNVCGNAGDDDLDGRCDFCTGRFLGDKPLNMKPATIVPSDAGSRVDRYLLREYADTETKFLKCKLKDRSEIVLLEEVPEDVQTAKLLVAYDYMQLRNSQLEEQLKELKSWVTH